MVRDLTVEARNHVPSSGFSYITKNITGEPIEVRSAAHEAELCRIHNVAKRDDQAWLEKQHVGHDWKTGKPIYWEPSGRAFGRSVGALYGVAYTLKFARKPAGRNFGIGPLEGLWWAEGAGSPFGVAPRETWRWRLRIAVPGDVAEAEVAGAIRAATTKKGGKLEGSADAARVGLERIPAATMGRVLHVGPYADEPASFEKIRAALAAAGRTGGLAHLEVYLSDPRRTRPEKLRTVLLLEAFPGT